jgi:branched-chain amino acid transport system permease protein
MTAQETSSPDCRDTVFRPALWSAVPRAIWPIIFGVGLAYLIQELLAPELSGFSSLLVFAGINIILAVSLNIVNGYAGQFSIGHGGFMALGGYLGAAAVYYGSYQLFGDFSFRGGWLSYEGPARNAPQMPIGSGELLFLGGCIFGGVVAAAAGWLVGLPSLRLRGDYLAIVTLGFGEIVRVLLEGTPAQIGPRGLTATDTATLNQTPFPFLLWKTGGAQAFNGLPPYASTFWIYVWVAITLAVAIRIKYSGYGRSLLSIREDEVAARSVGVNVTRYNVRAFMLSAFFAGVAGVLTALNIGQIKAGDLGFQRSFEIVIMVVLGGLGSISGAVLAAILLTILPELLRDPPSLVPFGLPIIALIAVVILLRADRKARAIIILLLVCAAYEGVRYGASLLNIRLAEYRMIFYALTLIVLMILRPQGLFGVHEVWDVWPLKNLRASSHSIGIFSKIRTVWLFLMTGHKKVPRATPAIIGAGEPATRPSLDLIEHATPGDFE